MKKLSIIILLFLRFPQLLGQTTAASLSEIDQYYYQGYLKSSAEHWKTGLIQSRNISDQNQENTTFRLKVAEGYLGLLNAAMAHQDKSLFNKYLDEAKQMLNQMIKDQCHPALAQAFLGAIYGYEIGFSPVKGMILGPKSQKLLAKAVAMAPQDPVVLARQALSKFFTPEMFGGDTEESAKLYQQSVGYFEQGSTHQNWQYLDALAWLGQTYASLGQTTLAKQTFVKALELEPDFYWVKRKLLPELEKSLKK
ncbi:MAG: hypothetical protein ACNS62_02545 [Candidatus Cyclobacteriaceae bacterium M3_2C_046]